MRRRVIAVTIGVVILLAGSWVSGVVWSELLSDLSARLIMASLTGMLIGLVAMLVTTLIWDGGGESYSEGRGQHRA